ncbi:MAG: hypothetical protein OXG49_08160 [Chloroflexi bacterium]|nr:hypothetical protein [Chloroflexota bacterium]
MPKLPLAGRTAKPLLILATVALGLSLYLHIAIAQNEANQDWGKVDQGAYMYFAKEAYETNFAFSGNRNRMPLFPWIQALLYSPEMSDEAFFEQGKRVNVLMSLACLAVLGAAFFLKFSQGYALYSISVIAFLLFAIKAPWFQAEILFYTLFAFAFMLSIESIRSPRWYKSVGLGLLFALAHFTKASATPGIALYACSFAVPLLATIRNRLNRQRMVEIVSQALLPLLVFSVGLFPYFNESKERYGHYLYNVNSTFYVWYDSWGEAKFGTKAAGDREGWPDMPAEEIPSLTKYLKEHSIADIVKRFVQGAIRIHNNACSGSGQFGLCIHAGIGVMILIVSLSLRMTGARGTLTKEDIQSGLFASLFILGYILLYVWYAAIASGPRFILTLLIPLFWSVGLALPAIPKVYLPGLNIGILDAVFSVMLVILLSQVYELATVRASLLVGGF